MRAKERWALKNAFLMHFKKLRHSVIGDNSINIVTEIKCQLGNPGECSLEMLCNHITATYLNCTIKINFKIKWRRILNCILLIIGRNCIYSHLIHISDSHAMWKSRLSEEDKYRQVSKGRVTVRCTVCSAWLEYCLWSTLK